MTPDNTTTKASEHNDKTQYFLVLVALGEGGSMVRIPAYCNCGFTDCTFGDDMTRFMTSVGLEVIVESFGNDGFPESAFPAGPKEAAFGAFITMAFRSDMKARRMVEEHLAKEQAEASRIIRPH